MILLVAEEELQDRKEEEGECQHKEENNIPISDVKDNEKHEKEHIYHVVEGPTPEPEEMY